MWVRCSSGRANLCRFTAIAAESTTVPRRRISSRTVRGESSSIVVVGTSSGWSNKNATVGRRRSLRAFAGTSRGDGGGGDGFASVEPSSVDEAEKIRREVAAKAADATTRIKSPKTKAIFPWRHEILRDDSMIPRLTPGTAEYESDIRLPEAYQGILANFFLNLPVHKTVLFNQAPEHWGQELAESTAWAFAQGVAGIVSNTYRVPLDSVLSSNQDNDKVDFDYSPTTTATGAINGDTEASSSSSSKAGEGTETTSAGAKDDQGDDEEMYCPHVEDMLCPTLWDLYQSAARSGKDQIRIRLHTEPTNAILCSLFCFPFLTRQASQNNRAIRQQARKVIQLLDKSHLEAYKGFDAWVKTSRDHLDREGNLETTIDMHVLVQCQESFQVFDAETGQLLQGTKDGSVQTVAHLVHMEGTIETIRCPNFPFFESRIHGNWKIKDIDDLMGPKKWYHELFVS